MLLVAVEWNTSKTSPNISISSISLTYRPLIWLPRTLMVNLTHICWSALDSKLWIPKIATSQSSLTQRLGSQYFIPVAFIYCTLTGWTLDSQHALHFVFQGVWIYSVLPPGNRIAHQSFGPWSCGFRWCDRWNTGWPRESFLQPPQSHLWSGSLLRHVSSLLTHC